MNRRLKHELSIRRQIDRLYKEDIKNSVRNFDQIHESALVGSPLSVLNTSPKSFRTHATTKSPTSPPRRLEPIEPPKKSVVVSTSSVEQQQHHKILNTSPVEQQQHHEILNDRPLRIRISHNDPRLRESPYAQQGAAVLIETRNTYAASATPTFISGRVVDASKQWSDTLRPEQWRGEWYLDIEDLMLHCDGNGESKNLCGLSYVKINRSLKYTASSTSRINPSSHFAALAVLTGSTGRLIVMFSPVSISALAFKCDPYVEYLSIAYSNILEYQHSNTKQV